MTPIFFKSQSEFRKWLEKNHKTESEILVGFRKVATGALNMTWSQSVDAALCYGWIDGVRRSIDKDSYCIRFTPRKRSSNWSAVNLRKIEELQKQGLMHPSGMEAFINRKEAKTGVYSFENRKKPLSEDLENHFKANKSAWEFFIKQAPSYQKTMIFWINSAKQESTRLSRLETLISACNNGKRVGN